MSLTVPIYVKFCKFFVVFHKANIRVKLKFVCRHEGGDTLRETMWMAAADGSGSIAE